MKNSIKSFFRNFFKLTIPTLIVLFIILELFFRFIIPASEKPKAIFDKSGKIWKYSNKVREKGIHTIGKLGENISHFQVNNEGWISPYNYYKEKNRPRIAVIGDSFVAALEVSTGDGFPHQLAKHFNETVEVYSFGFSGSPLSHYFQVAKYVEGNFEPDMYVVNLVYNDFNESINHLTNYPGRFWTCELQPDSSFIMIKPEINFTHSRVKSLISKSAVFRYFIYNLKIQKNLIMKFRKDLPNHSERFFNYNDTNNKAVLIKKVISYLLQNFKTQFPNRPILFTMDGPRRSIYKDWQRQSDQIWLNDYVKQECNKLGFMFLDLYPYFEADYKKNNQIFEFKEDNHWNTYAHSLVGEILHSYLDTIIFSSN